MLKIKSLKIKKRQYMNTTSTNIPDIANKMVTELITIGERPTSKMMHKKSTTDTFCHCQEKTSLTLYYSHAFKINKKS